MISRTVSRPRYHHRRDRGARARAPHDARRSQRDDQGVARAEQVGRPPVGEDRLRCRDLARGVGRAARDDEEDAVRDAPSLLDRGRPGGAGRDRHLPDVLPSVRCRIDPLHARGCRRRCCMRRSQTRPGRASTSPGRHRSSRKRGQAFPAGNSRRPGPRGSDEERCREVDDRVGAWPPHGDVTQRTMVAPRLSSQPCPHRVPGRHRCR
jgi:hypothetical protein